MSRTSQSPRVRKRLDAVHLVANERKTAMKYWMSRRISGTHFGIVLLIVPCFIRTGFSAHDCSYPL